LTSDTPEPAFITSHHCYVAHGLSVPAIRRNSSGAKVGITLNLTPADPATTKPGDLEATTIYDGWFNRWYLDPLYRGRYPQDIMDLYAASMPRIEPGDMQTIAAPLDFLGINYYARAVIKAGTGPEQPYANEHPEGEYTAMGWEVYPMGLYNLLKRIHSDYNPPSIYITENGAAYEDVLTPSGEIHDERRTAYYQSHLEAVHHAIQDGVRVDGYFAWSLLDNFEWAYGYAKRFGLYYVDYATQQRYLKDSGKFYAQVAATGIL
jgi:beta-glucosidase